MRPRVILATAAGFPPRSPEPSERKQWGQSVGGPYTRILL
jgi:hypothetical protein